MGMFITKRPGANIPDSICNPDELIPAKSDCICIWKYKKTKNERIIIMEEHEIAQLKKEITEIKGKIQYEDDKIRLFTHEIMFLEQQMQNNKEVVTMFNARINELFTRMKDLKNQIPDFSEETYDLYKEYLKIDNDIKALQKEQVHYTGQNESAEDKINTLKTKIKECECHKEQLQKELDEK